MLLHKNKDGTYELTVTSILQLNEKGKCKGTYEKNFPTHSVRPIVSLYQNQRHHKRQITCHLLFLMNTDKNPQH